MTSMPIYDSIILQYNACMCTTLLYYGKSNQSSIEFKLTYHSKITKKIFLHSCPKN